MRQIAIQKLTASQESEQYGEWRSPRANAEQQVRQLRDVLRIGTVAVEKVSLLDQLPQLSVPRRAIVVSRTQFYEFVAHRRPRHHYYGYLRLHTSSHLVHNIEHSIRHKNTDYFAAADSLRPLLALRYLDAEIDFKLHFSSPLQIFVGVVCVEEKILTKKRCVWPFASSVPSTWEGFILGNFIQDQGAIPSSFTPRLRVNFSRPDASPLSTITASVLNAALAIPAQNLPLPFSIAPIMLTTGVISVYLNLSSISLTGKFFLQILLTLISLASLPPGNRKSQGFHSSSFAMVFCTLTIEFFSLSSRSSLPAFASSFISIGSGLPCNTSSPSWLPPLMGLGSSLMSK